MHVHTTSRVYHRLPAGQIFTHHTLTLTHHTHTGYGYTLTHDYTVFFTKPMVCLIPTVYIINIYTFCFSNAMDEDETAAAAHTQSYLLSKKYKIK